MVNLEFRFWGVWQDSFEWGFEATTNNPPFLFNNLNNLILIIHHLIYGSYDPQRFFISKHSEKFETSWNLRMSSKPLTTGFLKTYIYRFLTMILLSLLVTKIEKHGYYL